TTTSIEPKAPVASKLSDVETNQLIGVVNNYYELKDAMVATNALKADEAADKLQASVDTFASNMKADTANYAVVKPYLDSITVGNKKILSVKDAGCEVKRIHFETVSNAMYDMLKITELKNAGVYRQYCPMAFNDKGAYWLSNEAEIKNPYFGKKMLECGEVTDSL
ncbi:MAG: DUF3347 domain-containing protein, partial [Sphingobacteriales bacterium]